NHTFYGLAKYSDGKQHTNNQQHCMPGYLFHYFSGNSIGLLIAWPPGPPGPGPFLILMWSILGALGSALLAAIMAFANASGSFSIAAFSLSNSGWVVLIVPAGGAMIL